MRRRGSFAIHVFVCAWAAVGCQLLSGASSLTIDEGAPAPEQEGGRPDATGDALPPEDGPVDAAVPNDANVDADAEQPFLACVADGGGGAFTTCRTGGIPEVTNCIEYCATQHKCCAEDCKPYTTDPSIEAAEFTANNVSICIDPLSGPTGNESFTACSNSPLPGPERAFKCCCR